MIKDGEQKSIAAALRSKPVLILGLGNPDDEYKDTYHNVGSLLIDALTEKLDKKETDWQKKPGVFSYVKADDFILAKPLIFMNESGLAAKAALNYFKIKTDKLMVVHDDSDLFLGNYKFSLGRGSAGHRGVESIIKSLGTKDFWRLRIGIRKTAGKRIKAGDLVLKKISKSDSESLKKIFKEIEKIWLS